VTQLSLADAFAVLRDPDADHSIVHERFRVTARRIRRSPTKPTKPTPNPVSLGIPRSPFHQLDSLAHAADWDIAP
jgi:hypothetical protein